MTKPLSDHAVLHSWLLGGPKPARVASDLVFGCIRWERVLGLPSGKLDAAFFIECYHVNRIQINLDQTKQLREPHAVDAWEGPHDDHYFRVSFLTDARTPSGYFKGSKDPLRNVNLLNVRLSTHVSWKNNTFTGPGRKVFVPSGVTFNPPHKAQLLPDIDVVHLPPAKR